MVLCWSVKTLYVLMEANCDTYRALFKKVKVSAEFLSCFPVRGIQSPRAWSFYQLSPMPWGPLGVLSLPTKSPWPSVFHGDSAFCFEWNRKMLKDCCEGHGILFTQMDIVGVNHLKTVWSKAHIWALGGPQDSCKDVMWTDPLGPISCPTPHFVTVSKFVCSPNDRPVS